MRNQVKKEIEDRRTNVNMNKAQMKEDFEKQQKNWKEQRSKEKAWQTHFFRSRREMEETHVRCLRDEKRQEEDDAEQREHKRLADQMRRIKASKDESDRLLIAARSMQKVERDQAVTQLRAARAHAIEKKQEFQRKQLHAKETRRAEEQAEKKRQEEIRMSMKKADEKRRMDLAAKNARETQLRKEKAERDAKAREKRIKEEAKRQKELMDAERKEAERIAIEEMELLDRARQAEEKRNRKEHRAREKARRKADKARKAAEEKAKNDAEAVRQRQVSEQIAHQKKLDAQFQDSKRDLERKIKWMNKYG